MKRPVEIVYQACRFLAVSALLFGFVLTGRRTGVIVTLGFTALWLILRRSRVKWLPPARLAGFAGIAVWGLIDGVPPASPVAGVTFALACWELEERVAGSEASTFDVLHLKWLGAACLISLAAGVACIYLRIYLPFEAVLMAALLVLFGIYQMFLLFRSRQGGRIE